MGCLSDPLEMWIGLEIHICSPVRDQFEILKFRKNSSPFNLKIYPLAETPNDIFFGMTKSMSVIIQIKIDDKLWSLKMLCLANCRWIWLNV